MYVSQENLIHFLQSCVILVTKVRALQTTLSFNISVIYEVASRYCSW